MLEDTVKIGNWNPFTIKELGTIRCVGNLLWEEVLLFVLIIRC